MVYEALDIAKYIVTYCIGQGKPISNLKLQKMLYFAWIDYYKETRGELFLEDICAWQFGPVVPEVYYEFCVYGGFPITQEYKVHVVQKDREILDGSIDRYAANTISELVNRTHQPGKPWALTYKDGAGLRMTIPYDTIIALECNSYVK